MCRCGRTHTIYSFDVVTNILTLEVYPGSKGSCDIYLGGVGQSSGRMIGKTFTETRGIERNVIR